MIKQGLGNHVSVFNQYLESGGTCLVERLEANDLWRLPPDQGQFLEISIAGNKHEIIIFGLLPYLSVADSIRSNST